MASFLHMSGAAMQFDDAMKPGGTPIGGVEDFSAAHDQLATT